MAKEQDRHLGRRESIWFPWDEHQDMCEAMKIIHETNKSNFIRSAVRYLGKVIREEGRK